MKIIMQEAGSYAYGGYKEKHYSTGQDISSIPTEAKDYFLKVKKAKQIVEKAKAEKAKAEKAKKLEEKKVEEKKAEEKPKKTTTKKKSVKVEENKMVKKLENK